LQSIHDAINGINFLFVNANEVTKIDNASWISLHFYVIQGYNQSIILVCVKKVDVQGTTSNVFQLMLRSLDSFAGVSAKDLGLKLISMGCDGNSVFQGARVGGTTQMKEIVVPFMIKVHCFVHLTNLVVLVLLKLSLVTWLEVLLQAM
jgi:hypothetical protein